MTSRAVLRWVAMRRFVRSAGGWCASVCVASLVAWGCSSDDTNPFTEEPQGGQSSASGSNTGGSMSGSSMGGSTTGGSGAGETGGTSGSSSGGDANGGTMTGGSTGDGGAAADAGADSGGATTGGMGGTSGSNTGGSDTGGSAGAPMGGAGMGGAGMSGAGMSGAGMSGTGGKPDDCKVDSDCDDGYCKKASCDADSGNCAPVGPDCYGDDAVFAPVCGCDGTTFFNTCVLAHAGMNAASQGECSGNDRPPCTREDGGTSCPSGGDHARCYRPVDVCGDPSPTRGYCWVVPGECPPDEPQTERYCGGTAGSARCIGLCEVLEAENSFRRDSATCD